MTRSVPHKGLLAGVVFCALFSSVGVTSAVPRFKPLLSLGRGDITNVEWQASSGHIFVNTSHSLWVYDDSLKDVMHSDDIRLAVLHPSLNLLGGDYQGKPAILDATTLNPIHIFAEPVSSLSQLKWSFDGSKLADAMTNGLVNVWDAKTYKLLLQYWESPETAPALNWSPDSEKLLALDPGKNSASSWNVNTARKETSLNLKAKSRYNTPGGKLIWNANSLIILRIVGLQETGLLQNWDARTGALLYETENQGTYSSAYSPDGKKLLLDQLSFGLTTVDPEKFGVLVSYDQFPMIVGASASWSHNGNLVVGYGDNFLTIPNGFLATWDANTGKLKWAVKSHSPVSIVLWSPDDRRFLTANADNSLRIVDVNSGEILAENAEHGLVTQLMAWNTDGSKIAIADHVNTVRVWDMVSKQLVATLQGSPDLIQMAWQPAGKLLAVLSFASGAGINSQQAVVIRIWDTESSRVVGSIPYPDQTDVTALHWSRDGKRLLVATYGSVIYWDSQEQKTVPLLDLAHTPVGGINVEQLIPSPDDSKLLILSYVGCAAPATSIWDASSGNLLNQSDWSPGPIRLGGSYTWSLASDKVYRTALAAPRIDCGSGGSDHPVLDPDRFNAWIQVIYHADGSTEIPPMLVLRHLDWVKSADWSPDLSRIASTTADKYLRIWNATNGKLEHAYPNVEGYSWSSDGRFLALWQNNPSVQVLDVSTGKTITALRGLGGPLNWSPDSRFLALSQPNGAIVIVDVLTGAVNSTLQGLNGPVNWSPDGTKLTQFSDGQLIIWAKS